MTEVKTREDEILGGTRALRTILVLSIGPLFGQVTTSLYGFVNTLWLRFGVSELATTALASTTTIDPLSMNCGFYLSTCCASKVAALFGEHRGDAAAQIIVDMIRVSFVFAILLPAVLIPVSGPLMKWFGASQEVIDLGKDYLIPLVLCALITCVYLMLCGCLQAEGRTYFFAIVQVSSLVLNAGVFNPLFILGFKLGIRGAALSQICSQLVPGLVIFFYMFKGKFTSQPKFRMFIKKPSPELWQTLKIGLPSLVGAVSATLPSIVFQKFIGASCNSTHEFNIMMSLYNAYNRIYQIAIALFMAVTSGFLPSGSFAFAANRKRRVLFLFAHTTWLVTGTALLLTIILYAANSPVARIFSKDDLFKERFWKCNFPYWTTCPLCSWQYIITALLQVCQRPIWAFIGSFVTQIAMWPTMACAFYFTNKHDVIRLFFAVMSNDIASATVLIPPMIVVLVDLCKGGVDQKLEIPQAEGTIDHKSDAEEEVPDTPIVDEL